MTTPKPASVGLCHCCDQPVYPGQEDRRTIATGGASGGGDILLHKDGCKPQSEAPRRHN